MLAIAFDTRRGKPKAAFRAPAGRGYLHELVGDVDGRVDTANPAIGAY
jgi:hypothetical protein